MLCLGIETSCDDTSLALLQDAKPLVQVTSSQASLHALFGGVVPELASREHSRLIGPLCDALFTQAGRSPAEVDFVSVARGPGLLGSLLVGVAFGKAFAVGTGAGILGVNHLHAHLMIAAMQADLVFPALGLLVSGGHTHFYKILSPEKFTLLGKTLDDAAGEAFDKAGKMLGLPYPAGRHIDTLASAGTPTPTLFPRPYTDNDTLDCSFSGLKTAMGTYLAAHPVTRATWNPENGELAFAGDPQPLRDICASYTLAIVDTLCIKTSKALARNPDCGTLVLAGGVAANSALRLAMEQLAGQAKVDFLVPPLEYCMDNAMMVGYLGSLLAARGYRHDLAFEAVPRGRPVPDDFLQI